MSEKISVGIVTYNSMSDIDKVMSSVEKSVALADMKVYVIDNASADSSADYVEKKYPFAEVVRLPENIGFGQGHNAIFGKLSSKYHVIVNPDISFSPDTIDKMSEYMDANPDISILTPRIINDDGTEQFLPKKYAKIKYLVGGRLEKFGGIFYRWRSEYTMRDAPADKPCEIDCCTGCFMFCRTSSLIACGGFDKRYFLYFEDADLTCKMQQYGKTVYNPDIAVTHSWKRENGSTFKGFCHAMTSSVKFMWKWRRGIKKGSKR